MKISDKGKALIQHFESCELRAYLCPAGVWTVGWGATGDGIKRGTVWTQAMADAWLENRLAKDGERILKLLNGAPTTQRQFDALVSFAYNVGVAALTSSTLLKRHIAGRYDEAQAEFKRWDKAGGRVLAGLTKRRAAEAALYGEKV